MQRRVPRRASTPDDATHPPMRADRVGCRALSSRSPVCDVIAHRKGNTSGRVRAESLLSEGLYECIECATEAFDGRAQQHAATGLSALGADARRPRPREERTGERDAATNASLRLDAGRSESSAC